MIENFPPKRFDNEAHQRSHEKNVAEYTEVMEAAPGEDVATSATYWDSICSDPDYPIAWRVYAQDFSTVCRNELAKRGL